MINTSNGKNSRGNLTEQLEAHRKTKLIPTRKKKINSIRAEADAAIAKAEALEARVKELEQEQTQNEREIVSLTNRNKQLEDDLETAHEKIKELKGSEQEGSDLKKEYDNAMRKISILEQELEDSDRALGETAKRYVYI